MGTAIKRPDVSQLGEAEKIILIEMLQEQVLLLKEQVLLLKEKTKRLEKRNKELENGRNKNSRNSHKPPSSDFKKSPKKTTSSKQQSGKKPGGQHGHKGTTLEMVKRPNKIVRLPITRCGHCGKNLKRNKPRIKKRQEFEIPQPKMIITEYQVESKNCSCGFNTTSCFPSWITHQAQYGPRAKSLMVYMNQYQFLPFERGSQFFESVYDHKVSPATIVNTVKYMGNRLDTLEKQIKSFLIESGLVNCDETSMSINGTKQWLHTVGDKKVAHYALHKKRGKQATIDVGILPKFSGTMVHDHWKSYFYYDESRHALCNAHHLRELRYIHENHDMKWAQRMSLLLLQIKEKKEQALSKGKHRFSRYTLKKYNLEYDNLLEQARKEQARRGTLDSHNLIKRFKSYKENILLFMNDFTVPFTNNLSEQDLRMSKIKQKISGCFRNIKNGEHFCKIRSLIVTAKKNKKNIFETIQTAFNKTITLDELLAV